MSKIFTGKSNSNNIEEALNDAIAKAKEGLTSSLITWKLDFIVGESGGFILKNDLFVGIEARPSSSKANSHVGYFKVEDGSASKRNFIVQITNPKSLKIAREILSGDETERVHIMGTIVKEKATYNPDWSYHVASDSIDFFAFSIEVCDATMEYVEDNLADAGGAFLPNNHWCPWTSKLIEELDSEKVDAIASKG